MFTVYYSNQLETQKKLLLQLLKVQPNYDPFKAETILVQSTGMAQWLQMEIAQEDGVAINFEFPFPTSFLWKQYRNLLPELPKENIFDQKLTVWRLMQIIPHFLDSESFSSLKFYLGENPKQARYYQLAKAIAELFDQYLVYRPHWLIHWENNQNEKVLAEIFQYNDKLSQSMKTHLQTEVQWQSELWNALVARLKQDSNEAVFTTSHRAYFQQHFFDKLNNLTAVEKHKLPQRIFIFGISSLPISQLETLVKLSEHCDIHLFFLNPSQYYWGNILEEKMMDKIALYNGKIGLESEGASLSSNPLLTMWGKQGRDFFNILLERQDNEISAYIDPLENRTHLLAQLQHSILNLTDEVTFTQEEQDYSIQLHSCHSPLREVEVLYDQLLHLFEQDSQLAPKDIIVMSPNIDLYAPYITAVFERKDPCAIPYSISDQHIQDIDPVIKSFLHLLSIKESICSAEEMFELLSVTAIQNQFNFSTQQIEQLRDWIKKVGIRSGLKLENPQWNNYNSWENGLNRLLLGSCLKEENGVWEATVAFDESYGLQSEISGQLSQFICKIIDWIEFLHHSHNMEQWKGRLKQLIEDFYLEDETNINSLLALHNAIDEMAQNVTDSQFNDVIDDEIIMSLMNELLENNKTHLNFLAGSVNFATLLPMRSIPFKVVCLLGMSEKHFPRQYHTNSFDLMRHAPQKGDRAKREDDRYLFLEALLSAKDIFYISYVGQSLIKNQLESPSVLVSQLCDFLPKKGELSFFESNVIQHSMTAFNPINFTLDNPHRSYAKSWLETLNPQDISSDFLMPINNKPEIHYIDLDDLIHFIQQPIKFFFNHHLGVNFSQYDTTIEETEPFNLSNLEKFQFYDELLITPPQKFEDFFNQEKLKGTLPTNGFGEVTQHHLINELTMLHQYLTPYIKQGKQTLPLYYKGDNLPLYGNLRHYQTDDHIMLYRAGKLRDKDIIQMWLYHLLLQVNDTSQHLVFYYKNDNKIGKLTFQPVEQSKANELLDDYINDYLESFNELQWGIYQNLETFFKQHQKATSLDQFIQQQLDILATENYNQTNHEKVYLSRILNQTSGIIYQKIYQKTLDWFTVMWESKNIAEGNNDNLENNT
ncbi:exodeoxyribonuclease V subunit gamma [Pasteurella skyensis]|uniref:RecBCD enzyme subunit RecC n=1 Tax=Phocoenobacter skyensis TaxID=97481 RepID=A0AAJ6P1B2_9PAST|nr:exodeoxyribonuclease V subunit gamma [Pasteurella skyensis]MDP8162680.1 exodeoxyribonuclease V subunit gamma [Pasteurella skyensis]MDP8173448.1 exodeoxyribonuclease V subunit gamma [Pasteurella skyensis]MDP8177633.1 exodeoxyribonuclease V subunit gamma [Pasteurella skyensis]MDP8178782.1 exodeoxyribonuclease V subunit gamma [Pasteurella skyensis]MDP8183082.1 exodeoxyribonuclease V subunit gamma [Pasteurella skyensis]